MDSVSPIDECNVCGRRLAGGRWVGGGRQLKHSGRAVAQAVVELLGCEAWLSWLCFRCYRLVLGSDYHKHQLEKQRQTLVRLYEERGHREENPNTCTEGKKAFQTGGGSGGISEKSFTTNHYKETAASHSDIKVRTGKQIAFDGGTIAYEKCANDKVIGNISPCTPQYPADSGHLKNNGTEDWLVKAVRHTTSTSVMSSTSGLEPHCKQEQACDLDTKKLHETLEGRGDHAQNNESPMIDNNSAVHVGDRSVFDIDVKTEQNESEIVQGKNIEGSSLQQSQALSSKRRKIVKKWEDFEYYEAESKNTESNGKDGDGVDNLSQNYPFRITPGRVRKRCMNCRVEFSTKKAYFSHECCQTKKSEKEKVIYTCKGCQSVFHVRREYIKHTNSCYKNMPVTCQICLVKLPSAAYLPRHLTALHQVQAQLNKCILCEQCGKGFSRKEALERHEARVHGTAHGSHQCSLCGRTFLHTSLLAEHMRAHRAYTCNECGKAFSCRSNLTLHQRAHHLKKAVYHCSFCNKHWRFHASYTYHMRKFHGSGEHRCPRCKLVLASQSALHRHSLTCAVQERTAEMPSGDAVNTDVTTPKAFGLKRDQIGEEETGRPTTTITAPSVTDAAAGSKFRSVGKNTPASLLHLHAPASFLHSDTPTSLLRPRTPAPFLCPAQSTDDTCVVGEQESLMLMPEARESQLYQAGIQNTSQAPAGEIILEVLEDMASDCQYIILVEDATGPQLR